MSLFGFFKPQVENKEHEKKSVDSKVMQRQNYEVRKDLADFRVAIDDARNIFTYNRRLLHEVYRKVLRDLNIGSQWNTRKLKTIDKEFKVVKGDEEIDDLTQIFEQPWFHEWQHQALDSVLWGFSLIEFGVWDKTKRTFVAYTDEKGKRRDAISQVKRDFVKPELGIVGHDENAKIGVEFDDTRFDLMFIGKTHDLGMLLDLSAALLMKENAFENWSEWAEIFGMDIIIAHTDKKDASRDSLWEALKQLGSKGIMLASNDDKLDYQGTQRSDAYKVYLELCQYVDHLVSKRIFGQDVVSNNTGQVVGEIGENVSNLYGDVDAKLMKWLINDRLIPFLETKGIAFNGAMFEYDTTEQLTLVQNSEIDKRISEMGFDVTPDHILDTYGRVVEKKVNPFDSGQIQENIENFKNIKDLYDSGS